MQVFAKKIQKNLVNSKKSSTFAPAFRKKLSAISCQPSENLKAEN